jgi:Na+/H+-dicarboxylate symporter
MILAGLAAGVGCGVFFGEYCAKLAIVGDAFVGLLRMTVMPYIIVSLIANLGRLSRKQTARLAVVGGVVLLGLWSIALLTVFALANTFPECKAGSISIQDSSIDSVSKLKLTTLFSRWPRMPMLRGA